MLSANRDCYFTNARLRKCIDSISNLILWCRWCSFPPSSSLFLSLSLPPISIQLTPLPELVSEISFGGCFDSLPYYRPWPERPESIPVHAYQCNPYQSRTQRTTHCVFHQMTNWKLFIMLDEHNNVEIGIHACSTTNQSNTIRFFSLSNFSIRRRRARVNWIDAKQIE